MYHRYYQVAGITIKVNSDLEITDTTFHLKYTNAKAEIRKHQKYASKTLKKDKRVNIRTIF